MIPDNSLPRGHSLTPGSIHGLTPVTVHMSFSLPGATLRGVLPVVLAEVTFLHVNRTQKLPRGKSSLVHVRC